MLTRRHMLGGLLAACAPVSLPTDIEWADVVADRSAYDRLIVLVGDSLFQGWALGAFPSQLSPSHPLWRFRSIQSTANWALEQSGSSDRFVRFVCTTANPEGIGGNINDDDIRAAIAQRVIRDRDVVVLEDAGGHGSDPIAYRAFMAAARASVCDTIPITCIMMDMFEFANGTNTASNPMYQYEYPFGAETINDATRAAATEAKPYPGQTLLLPMRQIATDYRDELLSLYGLDPAHSDGIHMRVWLQMKMAGVLCKAAGARVTDVRPLIDYATQNIAALSYGSALFDEDAAALYVRDAFMPEPYDIITTESRSVLTTEFGEAMLSEFRH